MYILRYTKENNEYRDRRRFIKPSNKPLGLCPICKEYVIERNTCYCCSNEDCRFIVWKAIAGKSINKTYLRQLLIYGETEKIKGFTSRRGEKFDAWLTLENGEVTFRFAGGL